MPPKKAKDDTAPKESEEITEESKSTKDSASPSRSASSADSVKSADSSGSSASSYSSGSAESAESAESAKSAESASLAGLAGYASSVTSSHGLYNFDGDTDQEIDKLIKHFEGLIFERDAKIKELEAKLASQESQEKKSKPRKDAKTVKDTKNSKSAKDTKDTKDTKNSKDAKGAKGAKHTTAAKDIDPEIKKKASNEVKELGIIRRKLEKLQTIDEAQYQNLVNYTNPQTATVIPRGDNVVDRRNKIVNTFRIMWYDVTGEDKAFDNDDKNFKIILEHIKNIVKENMGSDESVDQILRVRFK